MKLILNNIFNTSDRLQMEALDHRQKRSDVISANIANSETPGFRALGYDFEDQLASIANVDKSLNLKTTNPQHFVNSFTKANGEIEPDVYIVPTESIGEDGNTVDVDREMAEMAKNQILYRSAAELINRKMAVLRYAINGGR